MSPSQSSNTPARDVFLAVTDAQPPKQWSKMLQSQTLDSTTRKGKRSTNFSLLTTKAACKQVKRFKEATA
jgi:hypothetical protein